MESFGRDLSNDVAEHIGITWKIMPKYVLASFYFHTKTGNSI